MCFGKKVKTQQQQNKKANMALPETGMDSSTTVNHDNL